jgi:hypothetical protein
MNRSVSQATGPHETKLRLIKLERKIESKKLLQLGEKLAATVHPKQSEVLRSTGGTWIEAT